MSLISTIQINPRARIITVLVAITISLSFVACDSWTRYKRIIVSMDGSMGTPFPAIDSTSPTGYELGMRKLILPQVGVDGCHWIMHTQKMLDDGAWRIRFTDIDNSPDGREIHWSHGLIWWLIILGKIHSSTTGLPLPASVEAVAPYSSTLILVVLIASLPWVVLRPFGSIAASGLALGLGGIYLFYEFFMVGNADHHGIAAASALMCALLLAVGGAGWVTTEAPALSKSRSSPKKIAFEYVVDSETARRFFIGSAAAGSISLWVSAATAVPTFFGIGLGVLLSAFFYGPQSKTNQTRYQPALWRLWGIAGCCGSFCFYLLEYFPFHMGMRLEVNHPLYSLAWLGAGEILSRLTRWRVQGEKPWMGKWALPCLLFAILSLLSLPVLIGFFPTRFFWIADTFLWNFHKDYIHEFKTFPSWVKGRGSMTLLNFAAIPFLTIVVSRLLLLNELGRSWKGMLTLILMPALLLSVLGFYQVRWLGISLALWLATIPTCLGCMFSTGFPHRFRVYLEKIPGCCLGCLILFFYPGHAVYEAVNNFVFRKPAMLGVEEAFGIYIRDLSYALRRANKDRELVVVSGPTTTTYMMYYGGMRGIGTLYWENLPGLKATAEIYAARSEQEALELTKRFHVSHIAVFKSDAFAFQYTRLLRGLPFGAESNDAFIPFMTKNIASPKWLKPIHVRPPVQLGEEWLVLLEVMLERTEAESHYDLSEFLEAKGERVPALKEVLRAIELDPEYRDAWFRLGSLQLLYEGVDKATEAFEKGLTDRAPIEVSALCERLGLQLYNASRHQEAAFSLRRALTALPDEPVTANALAWLLATSFDNAVRNPTEALALARGNVAFPNKAAYLDTLAASQAANGNMDEACVTMKQAIEVLASLEPGPNNPDLKAFAEHLRYYESGLPLRTGGTQ